MFVISQSDSYRYPVTFYTPKEDGTGYQENTFTAVFRRMGVKEIQDMTAKVKDDIDMARRVLSGWDGVEEKGAEFKFTPANLERLLDIAGFAPAVARAYLESVSGGPEKN